MGVVKKELTSRGMSAAGLTNLLMTQKDQIAKLAPPGLSNALGLTSMADLGSFADSVKAAGAGVSREAGRTAAAAASEGTAWLRWAAPLALLAVALGGLYWYNLQGQPAANPAQPPIGAGIEKPVVNTATPNLDRITPAIKDATTTLTRDGKALVETTAKMVALSLPGNVKLDVPENSYLKGLVKLLSDGGTTGAPKTVIAEDLTVDSSSGKLTDDSSTAVTRLTTVLKAFGTAKLKIIAYSDNMGEPAENKKTSLERATTIKDALVKAGVPADRILAEGAGPDHPIAPNDTEEGRAKNRRIELSIVPK